MRRLPPSLPLARRPVVVAMLVATVVTGCSGTDVSAGDRQVCRSLQRMVDALGDGRSADAVTTYDRMVADAAGHDEGTRITRLVEQMASVTDARIDESELRMSDVPELAQQAMVASGDTLAALVKECGAAGLRVTGLDRAGAGA